MGTYQISNQEVMFMPEDWELEDGEDGDDDLGGDGDEDDNW